MISAPFRKAFWFIRYLRVFSGLRDVIVYRRLRKDPTSCQPLVALRLRETGGAVMYCRPGTTDSTVLWDTFWNRYHLPPVILRPKAVILDLGANVGYTVAHMAALYPNATVIGVEMDKANAELARHNTEPFRDRCHIIHAAIWPEDGVVSYAGDTEWGFSVTRPQTGGERSTKSAPAISPETIIRDYKLGRIDYVKMDIEGAEAELLTSDAKWLEHVQALSVEVHSPASIEGCSDVLANAGFQCSRHPRHGHCVTAIARKQIGTD